MRTSFLIGAGPANRVLSSLANAHSWGGHQPVLGSVMLNNASIGLGCDGRSPVPDSAVLDQL
jgi:hypothetical protein